MNHLFSNGWPGGVTFYPSNGTSEKTDLYTLGDDDSDCSASDDDIGYIESISRDVKLKASVVEDNLDSQQLHLASSMKNMRTKISVTNFKYKIILRT